MKIKKLSKRTVTYIFILTIFLTFFLPRLFYLGFDEWVDDSSLWDSRSEAFYEALSEKDFKSTYQSYHPGVTVMWLATLGKTTYYKAFQLKNGFSVVKDTRKVYPENFYQKAFFVKLPLVFLISVLLTVSVYLLSIHLKSRSLMLVFSLLLSLEPFFLGVTRHLHLTGLLSSVFFLVISIQVCYFTPKKRYPPFIIGVVSAFAVLIKISFIIIFPFLVGLYFYKYRKFDKYFIYVLLKAFIGFLVTILLLWPALWVEPLYVVNKLFTTGVVENVVEGSSSAHLFTNKLFYIEEFFVRQTILVSSLFLSSFYFYKKEKKKSIKEVLRIFYFFIAYYVIIMSIPTKLNDRYFVVIMPFIIFCSTYALLKFYMLLKSRAVKFFVIAFVVLYLLLNFYSYFPCYSSYTSDLLLGMRGYSKLIKVRNTGEYYIDAIRYLRMKEGQELYNRYLLIENTRKVRSAQGYYGKIVYTGHEYDKSKLDYFLVDYTRLQKAPQNCTIEKSFGPRGPFKFDYLYLYKCN